VNTSIAQLIYAIELEAGYQAFMERHQVSTAVQKTRVEYVRGIRNTAKFHGPTWMAERLTGWLERWGDE
jgi:hypothetical protein